MLYRAQEVTEMIAAMIAIEAQGETEIEATEGDHGPLTIDLLDVTTK